MFEQNDILVFSNLNFNYVKDKVREIDMYGYEQEYGSKYGLIVSSKRNMKSNYNLLKGKKGYSVMKNGEFLDVVFATQGQARAYIQKQEEDEYIGAVYSFENPDEIDKDYLHLGTDDGSSRVIIMDSIGVITTRDF